MKNASFGKRLTAYIIDAILISIIASLIMSFIPTKNVDVKEINQLTEKYTKGKINTNTYIKDISEKNYKLEQSKIPSYILSLTLTFVYFVILQYKLKGQTLGKKILNIKVVHNEDGELTVNNYIFRSLIINELFYSMLSVLCIFIFKNSTFFYSLGTLNMINVALLITCAIMVTTRSDKRGLHDLVGNTKVIELEK